MRKKGGTKSKNAKASMAGMRGDHKAKTEFSVQFAEVSERRARQKTDKKEEKKIRENVAVDNSLKEKAREPHSFVIPSGDVGRFVKRLVVDMRQIMEPNTAKKLKVLRRNNVRDFVVNGAVLGVTHMIVFTSSERSVNMRMMRLSQGPTLTFRVKEYTLARHVLSSVKKPIVFPGQFQTAPLVVMSGFKEGQPRHLHLVQTTFQNLFPTINVDMLNLTTVRRCLMVRYNAEDDTIDIRHYAIKTVPTGMSKSTKKLMQSKVPDLSRYKDISEYFMNPGYLSDSGMEEESKDVELAQDMGRGCDKGGQTQIRLIELGPRLTIDLLKVEQGIDEGEVLYHKLVDKSKEEIEELKKKAPMLKKRREKQRRDTEHRVIRKLQRNEDMKKKEEEEMKAIREAAARKQAMATGQTEEVEADYAKDRAIALEREREMNQGGGEGQNEKPFTRKRRRQEGEEEGEVKKYKKTSNVKVAMKKFSKRK